MVGAFVGGWVVAVVAFGGPAVSVIVGVCVVCGGGALVVGTVVVVGDTLVVLTGGVVAPTNNRN